MRPLKLFRGFFMHFFHYFYLGFIKLNPRTLNLNKTEIKFITDIAR